MAHVLSMPTPPFRIKVCGVRLIEDVQAAAEAGGDAIGLNFYAPSVRSIDRPTASLLVAAAERLGICPVGLFVNARPEAIAEFAGDVGLTTIQLHGDESVEDAGALLEQGFAVVRAVRLPSGPLTADAIEAAVAPWAAIGCSLLLDADAGAAYGGQGRRLDWPSLKEWSEDKAQSRGDAISAPRRFILAGGLDPETVAEAVAASGAWGVDVASGVEASRGVKSAERIGKFAERARQSLGCS